MENILKKLHSKCGEGYIDVTILVLCAVMVLALTVKVVPVFIVKSQLNTFANELCREAEIAGRVGSETSTRAQVLREKTGLDPSISWSKTEKIQLNEEIVVTVSMQVDIGLFGVFDSFPIPLKSQAVGKSEVYWK